MLMTKSNRMCLWQGFNPRKMCGSRRYEYLLPLRLAYSDVLIKEFGLEGMPLEEVHATWGLNR